MNEPRPRDILGREETIFSAAVQLGDPGKRAIYLDLACEGDPALRARIEGLLASDAGDNLFAQPLVRPVLPGGGDATALAIPVAGAADAQSRAEFIGAYKLLEKIGEGGCGVVYVAEQEEPVRRRVALKVIKPGMDTRAVVARFEAERQALALMDHPNIAKVLEAGATDTGRPYFVMELVRGLRITDYCDQNHLSTRERLDLFIQVCRAVQHAHQKGIIHRDLKPSNILVTVNDGVAVPKVIDFGIAKATEGRLTDKTVYTELHHFLGTPAYMSPEQAELTSVDIDTRSDIYSLGVLLYELLTGGTPFDQQELLKAGLDAMRQTIRSAEPPRPSTRLSTLGAADLAGVAQARRSEPPKLIHLVRGDLDWIVMKCLEKDRARRYETANGLAADLRRHLDNEPVVARPPSAAYRVRKFVRRNRVTVTAATLVGAALVVGIAISTWQAVVAARAKTKAVAAQKAAERAQEEEKSTRLEAEQQLYAAKMNLAQQAWEQNNIGRLRQLLHETQDLPGRGFEWYFWQSKTHLGLKTLVGHLGAVHSVAYSWDGGRIVTGAGDNTARIWEAATGKELVTLKGHGDDVRSVAFSRDGQRVVTGSDDHTAKVWDAATGRNLLTLRGHGQTVWSVAFSPDGGRIVTGAGGQRAKVWDAASGNELRTLKGHSGRILSVAFSPPDGQWMLTGSEDWTAKIWDAASGLPADKMFGNLLTLPGHSGRVLSVAFSPDGQRIVTGGDDRAKVWEAASGREVLSLAGHSNDIWSVAFSPDGRRIVTGSGDKTAKVWDGASGKELFTLKGHTAWINCVAFSPDGQRIVTGSYDHTAKVWEAATAQQVEAWQREEKADAERLAALQREQAAAAEHERALRAQDPGAIKRWLVLAPFAFEGGGVAGSGAAALRQEQVPHEASLRPRAGDRVMVSASERVWKPLQLKDYLIDFWDVLGEPTEWSVAYAVCYIQSDIAQSGLLMRVGSDDEAKIYLNGKEIYRCDTARSYFPDEDLVEQGVALQPGLNVLVFKVVNEVKGWFGSVRLTDAAGQPVKGIRVTLTPP